MSGRIFLPTRAGFVSGLLSGCAAAVLQDGLWPVSDQTSLLALALLLVSSSATGAVCGAIAGRRTPKAVPDVSGPRPSSPRVAAAGDVSLLNLLYGSIRR
jgi:hypothetical protein